MPTREAIIQIITPRTDDIHELIDAAAQLVHRLSQEAMIEIHICPIEAEGKKNMDIG